MTRHITREQLGRIINEEIRSMNEADGREVHWPGVQKVLDQIAEAFVLSKNMMDRAKQVADDGIAQLERLREDLKTVEATAKPRRAR